MEIHQNEVLESPVLAALKTFIFNNEEGAMRIRIKEAEDFVKQERKENVQNVPHTIEERVLLQELI